MPPVDTLGESGTTLSDTRRLRGHHSSLQPAAAQKSGEQPPDFLLLLQSWGQTMNGMAGRQILVQLEEYSNTSKFPG